MRLVGNELRDAKLLRIKPAHRGCCQVNGRHREIFRLALVSRRADGVRLTIVGSPPLTVSGRESEAWGKLSLPTPPWWKFWKPR